MPKFNGPFTAEVTSGGDSAIQAAINAKALKATPPSGSLGALVKALFTSITPALASAGALMVVDFGRGEVTAYKHSSNNYSRINTALGSITSGAPFMQFAPSATMRSPGWEVNDSVLGKIIDSIVPYQTLDGDGNPTTDARSALEIAMATEFAPMESTATGQSLVDRIANVLLAQNSEGWMLIDETGGQHLLYPDANTSTHTQFQSATGVASLDSGAFIGVYKAAEVMPASAAVQSIW